MIFLFENQLFFLTLSHNSTSIVLIQTEMKRSSEYEEECIDDVTCRSYKFIRLFRTCNDAFQRLLLIWMKKEEKK